MTYKDLRGHIGRWTLVQVDQTLGRLQCSYAVINYHWSWLTSIPGCFPVWKKNGYNTYLPTHPWSSECPFTCLDNIKSFHLVFFHPIHKNMLTFSRILLQRLRTIFFVGKYNGGNYFCSTCSSALKQTVGRKKEISPKEIELQFIVPKTKSKFHSLYQSLWNLTEILMKSEITSNSF